MTKRVREILGYYDSENAGVRSNLARMLNHGKLAGTGKFVILPVDQGFEHGPARSFAINPPAYDPRYHFQLAIDAGCNAYAAPLGLLEAGVAEYAGEIPLILKANNHDVLNEEKDPALARDRQRQGRSAPGMRGDRADDLPGLDAGEVDVPGGARNRRRGQGQWDCRWSYGRTRAAPASASRARLRSTWLRTRRKSRRNSARNIIKVKPPTAFIEQAEAKKVYDANKVPLEPFSARIKHVMQSAFDGRRIVIFSGGAKETDDSLLNTVRGIHAGGGYGSIIGRNSFQRPKPEAIALLGKVIDIYKG